MKREGALPLSLLLGAFLLRAIPSLDSSYWYDEIYTVAMSARPFGEIVAITERDVHPPLYYWIVRALMLAGSALGGPFISISWLRLASILPGMAICAIGWRLARRFWGAEAGILALGLLAFSPPLAYFSVELRNYAFADAALFGALACLLRVAEAERRAAWIWSISFSLCAAAALYAANLSAIYLAALAAVYFVELTRRGAPRRRLLALGLAAAAMTVALYLPWIPHLRDQNARLQSIYLPWLPAASWADLFSTIFFYLPCGPLEGIDPLKGSWLAATFAGAAFFAALAARLAWQKLRGDDSAPPSDPLLIASLMMACVPLGIAFIDSRMGLARIFMPVRYNMMAAPFGCLALAGLARGLKPARLARVAAYALLAWSLAWCLFGQGRRAATRDDRIQLMPLLASFGFDPARDALTFTAPELSRWLPLADGTSNPTIEELGRGSPRSPRKAWFLRHSASWLGDATRRDRASALETALSARATTHENTEQSRWTWDGIWSAPSADIPEILRLTEKISGRVAVTRAQFNGAQMILPFDRPLHFNPGFAPALATDDGRAFCWTLGGLQQIEWTGPDRPGTYRLRASFWRAHPFPKAEQQVSYRFPGQEDWSSAPSPLGSVVIESRATIERPRQVLRVEFMVPPWIPSERIPGSSDDRALGLQFLSLELWPESDSGLTPGG